MKSLKTQYQTEIVDFLRKELGRKSLLSLPRLVKVSVSVGIGSAVTAGNKDYSHVEQMLMAVTGQKPNVRKARKAISNFKLREGLPVGLTVTLRGQRMYDFVERFVKVVLPRVRDFQGISVKGMDGKGNYSLGMKDCSIFPEINAENLAKVHGFQVNICTTSKTDREAYLLLKAMGFPFKDEVKPNNA